MQNQWPKRAWQPYAALHYASRLDAHGPPPTSPAGRPAGPCCPIRKARKEFDLAARRAHQDQFAGSPGIDDAVEALVDHCDFAVIDLTHERPSVVHEIGLCDREFDRAFILLIAKAGTPRFGNIQGRMVNYYDDLDHLRRVMMRQLRLMFEAWDQMPEDNEDDDDADD